MKNSRPVYSTESGRLCPSCGYPQSDCQCKKAGAVTSSGKPIAIWLERKGRGGKEVTVIRDLPLNAMELQLLTSALKKHCGTGGTVNNGWVEIQGNQREKVRAYLQQQGHSAKLAGG
ncbi:MAG: translation initiation factor [Gammaproteobacteria bacterium]|nr:translation initiation factor [Gammaproteobacteria bacterium]